MHPHEPGPVPVGQVKVGEALAVGVCATGSDEHGANGRPGGEIVLESGFHGRRKAGEVEGVGGDGGVDEGVDFREGVGGDDIDGLQGAREGRFGGRWCRSGSGRRCAREVLVLGRMTSGVGGQICCCRCCCC